MNGRELVRRRRLEPQKPRPFGFRGRSKAIDLARQLFTGVLDDAERHSAIDAGIDRGQPRTLVGCRRLRRLQPHRGRQLRVFVHPDEQRMCVTLKWFLAGLQQEINRCAYRLCRLTRQCVNR